MAREDARLRRGGGAETPKEGLSAIIALYEARDFDTLVRTRYAENSKAKGEEQIRELVRKFETRFADAEKIQRGIAVYRSALEMEPEISGDGNRAEFKLPAGVIRLSRMESGRWGFHL